MAMQIRTVSEEQKERLLVPRREDTASKLASEHSVARIHDPADLVALATYVQTADEFTKATVGSKLELITDQIRFLQEQARSVLAEAKRDVELTRARCNFKRIPNKTYHLYKRLNPMDGQDVEYFSMLAPEEWSGGPPDEHIGSYRLEADMSWTPVEKIAMRDARRRLNPALLGIDESQVAQLSLQLS